MRIGVPIILVTVLTLASHLAAQDPAVPAPARFFFRESSFEIPFAAQPGIAEVRLYVSADRGASWQLHSRQAPTAGKFIFQAVRDGEYLFASQSVPDANQAVLQRPERIEQVIVIDTAKPRLDFRSEVASNGTVTTTYQVSDPNLQPQSLRLEYSGVDRENFQVITAQPVIKRNANGELVGTVTWQPKTDSRAITVRAAISDAANNRVLVNRRLFLPKSNLQRLPASVASQPPSIPSDPFNQYQATPSAEFRPVANHHVTPDAAASAGVPAVPPADNVADHSASAPAPDQRQSVSGNSWSNDAQYPAVANEYRPTIDPQNVTKEAPRGFNPGLVPAGEQLNMTKSMRFSLDYDVDTVGPAGVASVELWTTADGGKSWRNWGRDPDNQSPFYVEVDQEGAYGFRMVIHGNNNLASATPKAGDLADIWIGVDTTKPRARITSAQYGDGPQTGSLVVRWEAFDAYLVERPIKLMYADNPDGPWNTIAGGLANTGEYAWRADPNLPPEIYLRMEVQDRAGNTAIYQPADAISMQGLTPKGRIRGFRAVEGEQSP